MQGARGCDLPYELIEFGTSVLAPEPMNEYARSLFRALARLARLRSGSWRAAGARVLAFAKRL